MVISVAGGRFKTSDERRASQRERYARCMAKPENRAKRAARDRAYQAARRASDPSLVEYQKQHRKTNRTAEKAYLKSAHGLSLEQYDALQ